MFELFDGEKYRLHELQEDSRRDSPDHVREKASLTTKAGLYV